MGQLCTSMNAEGKNIKVPPPQSKEMTLPTKKGILSPIRSTGDRKKFLTPAKFKIDSFELNTSEKLRNKREISEKIEVNENPSFIREISKMSKKNSSTHLSKFKKSPIQRSNTKTFQDQIENYEEFKLIKKTQDNKIYSVLSKITGKNYQLKEFKISDDNRPYIEEKNHLDISKKINCPFIIQNYSTFSQGNKFFSVSETTKTGFLIDMINKNFKFSEFQISMIAYQLLKSIIYLNSKKIMHRNINPENILVVDQEFDNDLIFVKIGDFRKAKIYEDSRKLVDYVGKGYFVAPEVITGFYNEKCDLWTIGVIIFILVEGRPPFLGETEKETKEKILNNKPVFYVASPEIKEFLLRILEKNEALRPTASELIESDLFRIQKIKQIFYTQSKSVKNVFLEKFTFESDQILRNSFNKYIVKESIFSFEFLEIFKLFNFFDEDNDGFISETDITSKITFDENIDIKRIFEFLECKTLNFQNFFSVFLTKTILIENSDLIFKIANCKLNGLTKSNAKNLFEIDIFKKLNPKFEKLVNESQLLNFNDFKFILMEI